MSPQPPSQKRSHRKGGSSSPKHRSSQNRTGKPSRRNENTSPSASGTSTRVSRKPTSHPYSSRHRKPKASFPPLTPGADPSLQKAFSQIGLPEQTPFTPDPFQLKALDVIDHSDCLVTAPTGSGKTWIAENAAQKILKKGGKVWYASPLKALSNAKYIEFGEIFGIENVGILTGDRKENPEAPLIVGTTEILRNQLYDVMYQGELLDTDFVILDEAHFLGDEDRGVVWEEIMIYLPSRIPLLLLSATIGNASQIADWLSAIRQRPCEVVSESNRPVPLEMLFMEPSGTLVPLSEKKMNSSKPRLSKFIQTYLEDKKPKLMAPPNQLPPMGEILSILREYNLLPAIFFLKSRSDCDNALKLCQQNSIEDPLRKEKMADIIDTFLEDQPHLQQHKQRHFLADNAVGAHHSGQLPAWKLLLEKLMSAGLLDAIFATSTVAAGVNFPARTILFPNSDRYNGREFVPLNPTEFHQMTGRAGRRGKDNIGFAVALPSTHMDLRLIERLAKSAPENVLSQLRINFSMALNLLLSHTPQEVSQLLRKSFATYLFLHGKHRIPGQRDISFLWNEFIRHLDFLKETGFVNDDDTLTPDGIWASQLRVDQPLLIAEGFRKNALPMSDPALMAAVITSFVYEREADEYVDRRFLPKPLTTALFKARNELRPFARKMIDHRFEARPLYLRPAAAAYAWATGASWETALYISEMAEGSLAMLFLRTADNLRQIRNLSDVFPEAAHTADIAMDILLQPPVLP